MPTPIDWSYSLVFDEEFNGTAIDTSVWGISDNQTFGQDSNTSAANNMVQNGFLRQQLTNVPSGGKLWTGAQIFGWTNLKFPNGWIGGYFETRCKMPGPNRGSFNTNGCEATVWMDHLDSFPENDLGGYNPLSGLAVQATYTNPDLTSDFGFNTGPIAFVGDPSQAFHVYGMLWTPSAVTFYVDGKQTAQFVDGGVYNINGTNFTYSVDTTTPQYLIIWNMINLNSAGTPNANSAFPYNFYVDYVHIYQKGGIAVAPQPGYGGPGDALGSGDHPGF